MGEDSEAVLATMRITDEDRADFSKVLEKFDDYFKFEKISSLNVLRLIKHASFQKNQLSSLSPGFTYLLTTLSLEIYEKK